MSPARAGPFLVMHAVRGSSPQSGMSLGWPLGTLLPSASPRTGAGGGSPLVGWLPGMTVVSGRECPAIWGPNLSWETQPGGWARWPCHLEASHRALIPVISKFDPYCWLAFGTSIHLMECFPVPTLAPKGDGLLCKKNQPDVDSFIRAGMFSAEQPP